MSTGSLQQPDLLCRRSIRNNLETVQGIRTSNSNGNVVLPRQSPLTASSNVDPMPSSSWFPGRVTKNNVMLIGGGSFQDDQVYEIRDTHGNVRTMTWKNGDFHLTKVEPSIANAASLSQGIRKDSVVLEGGGQFKHGEMYVVRDRHGNARTMVWQNGCLMPLTNDAVPNVSNPVNTTHTKVGGHRTSQVKPSNASLHQSTIRPELIKLMKQVFDLGYNKQLVKYVVKHATRGGTVVPDLNHFIDELEKVRKFQERAAARNQQGASGSSKDLNNTRGAHSSGCCKINDEYQRMKEQRQCKICMEKDVEITFIPCGHFSTCTQCGHPLTTCPICRQSIKSYIKTFMS